VEPKAEEKVLMSARAKARMRSSGMTAMKTPMREAQTPSSTIAISSSCSFFFVSWGVCGGLLLTLNGVHLAHLSGNFCTEGEIIECCTKV
jgi:hypothetical protein